LKGTIVVGEHTQDEILDSLNTIDEVAVCTRAGERLRARMMHFAADDDMTVYLASMKGDPKILQMTSDPSTSLLVLDRRTDQNGWREIEITGRASLVTSAEERAKALELTSGPSPIVSHLKSIGQTDILDFIRVTPLEVKDARVRRSWQDTADGGGVRGAREESQRRRPGAEAASGLARGHSDDLTAGERRAGDARGDGGVEHDGGVPVAGGDPHAHRRGGDPGGDEPVQRLLRP
jgi:hypothetical protein